MTIRIRVVLGDELKATRFGIWTKIVVIIISKVKCIVKPCNMKIFYKHRATQISMYCTCINAKKRDGGEVGQIKKKKKGKWSGKNLHIASRHTVKWFCPKEENKIKAQKKQKEGDYNEGQDGQEYQDENQKRMKMIIIEKKEKKHRQLIDKIIKK